MRFHGLLALIVLPVKEVAVHRASHDVVLLERQGDAAHRLELAAHAPGDTLQIPAAHVEELDVSQSANNELALRPDGHPHDDRDARLGGAKKLVCSPIVHGYGVVVVAASAYEKSSVRSELQCVD